MLSVLLRPRAGCRFYFELTDGASVSGGGLGEDGFLFCDPACPQKELLLRTLINKCRNDFVPAVYARDEWGLDLRPFGFAEEGQGIFCAAWEALALRHGCGH